MKYTLLILISFTVLLSAIVANASGTTLTCEIFVDNSSFQKVPAAGRALVVESQKDGRPLFGLIATRDNKTKKLDGATLQYYNPDLLDSTCE